MIIVSSVSFSSASNQVLFEQLFKQAKQIIQKGQLPEIQGMTNDAIMNLATEAFKEPDLINILSSTLKDYQSNKKRNQCHASCSLRVVNPEFIRMADKSVECGVQVDSKFNTCCIDRKICYETCGTTKKECDNSHQVCLINVCRLEMGEMRVNNNNLLSLDLTVEELLNSNEPLINCKVKAKSLFQMQNNDRECRQYKSSQKKACLCRD